jgi:hypothetical protein
MLGKKELDNTNINNKFYIEYDHKYNITQTHTDPNNPHFEVETYPDWIIFDIDKNEIHLIYNDFAHNFKKPKKIGINENCDKTYLVHMKKNDEDEFDCINDDFTQNPKFKDVNITYECYKTPIKYDTSWITKYVEQNPGKHDYIINGLNKEDEVCDYECEWYCDNKLYVLTFIFSTTYLLRCNGQLIYSLYAPETDLQCGDASTNIKLLNEKHIIIYNYGDVNSVITFKYLL